MGTRADFYIEKDNKLEWLGSIAWDGYCIDDIELASTEGSYIDLLNDFLKNRDDSTYPENGWPWPWNNSKLTDECYIFMKDKVWRKYRYDDPHNDFSTPAYFCPINIKIEYDEEKDEIIEPKISRTIYLPDMTKRKNVTYGDRSGLNVFGL